MGEEALHLVPVAGLDHEHAGGADHAGGAGHGPHQGHVAAGQDAVLHQGFHVVGAHGAEEGHGRLLLLQAFLHQAQGFLRLLAVVLAHQADGAAVDAALGVDVVDVEPGAGGDGLAGDGLGAAQGGDLGRSRCPWPGRPGARSAGRTGAAGGGGAWSERLGGKEADSRQGAMPCKYGISAVRAVAPPGALALSCGPPLPKPPPCPSRPPSPALLPKPRPPAAPSRWTRPIETSCRPLHLATTFERAGDGSYPGGRVYSRDGSPAYDGPEALLKELEGGRRRGPLRFRHGRRFRRVAGPQARGPGGGAPGHVLGPA